MTPESPLALAREYAIKPAAWIRMDHLRQAQQVPFMCRVEPSYRAGFDLVPIYTAPPVAQPLSDEALGEMWQEINNATFRIGGDRRPAWLQFARALLSASASDKEGA